MSDKNFKVKNGIDANGAVTITQPNTSTVPLTILANTLATGSNLLEVKRPDGSVRLSIGNDGALSSQNLSALNVRFYSANSGSWPLVLRGQASQTADLQQWRDVSENVLASVSASGSITAVDLTLSGNLTVNGTTTNLNSTNLIIEDKNIIIADVDTPTDTTADGAGITIKGATDKTFNWVSSTKSFTTSEPLIVDGTNSTTVPMLVKVPTNQTTNAFEVMDGQGYSMFKVVAPAGGTAYNNGSIWIRPWGTGNVAAMGTDSYQGFYFVSPSTSSIKFGTGGGGKAFEIVVGDTFNRYKVQGTGTGIAPIFTTDGNDTDVNMHIYPKGAGKIGINTTSPSGYVHIKTQDNTVPALVLERPTDGGTSDVLVVKTGTTIRFSLSNYGMVQGSAATFSNGAANTNTPLALINTLSTTKVMTIKAAASQTANLQEWQNSAGTVLTSISSGGNLVVGATGTLISYASGRGIFALGDPASVGLTVKGAASQTANLQEWQNSSGTVIALVNLQGVGRFSGLDNLGLTSIGTSRDGIASLLIDTNITTRSGIIIKGVSSQTANLQEWQDSSGTVLSSITNNGSIVATSGSIGAGGNPLSGVRGSYYTGNLGVIGLVVRSTSGQTANLQEWQDSSGAISSKINSNGGFTTLYSSINAGGEALSATRAAVYTGSNVVTGLVIRGAASQTADLQQWQNSSGTVLSAISAYGGLGLNSAPSLSTYLIIRTGASSVIGQIIIGASGQTANLQEWQNSAGTVLTSIDSAGRIFTKDYLTVERNAGAGGTVLAQSWSWSGGANWGLRLNQVYSTSPSGSIDYHFITRNNSFSTDTNVMFIKASGLVGFNIINQTSAQVFVNNSTAANVGLIVKGAASQSANLQEWQDSTGTVLASMSPSGAFSAVTKSFVIKHPTKEGKLLRYGSLEGPENGVYIRGKIDSSNVIELPDYWIALIDESTITVNLTPVGSSQNLYVEDIKDNKIYVSGGIGSKFFYTIFAERKDVTKLVVEE